MTKFRLLPFRHNLLGTITGFLALSLWAVTAFSTPASAASFSATEEKENASQLYEAAKRGDLPTVQKLVEGRGVPVDQRFVPDPRSFRPDSITPLMAAARFGKIEVVRYLLDKGADVNAEDLDQSNALAGAAINGDPDVLLAIISRKPRIDAHDNKGVTALMQAAYHGNLRAVEILLIDGKADVNARDNKDHTALMMASSRGHLGVVKALLQHSADVNAMASRDKGDTALTEAVSGERIDIVGVLLQHKSSVDVQTTEGRTPLMISAEKGNSKIVDLLLRNDANVNLALKDGWTALMLSAEKGYTEVVDLLLLKGANVDSIAKDGTTALSAAARHKQSGTIKHICNHLQKIGVPLQPKYAICHYKVAESSEVPVACMGYEIELKDARAALEDCRFQSDQAVGLACSYQARERVNAANDALNVCMFYSD